MNRTLNTPVDAEGSPSGGPGPTRIGRWSIDFASHRISSGPDTVRLEPKAMALLAYLARRPGQVVSRDTLLSALWPGVVVGDDSLTQVVIKLRKALGDAADRPTYIETIAKGGYRLIAPVVQGIRTNAREAKAKKKWAAHAGALTIIVTSLAAVATAWLFDFSGRDVAADRSRFAVAEAALASQPAITVRPLEPLGNDPQAALLARGITADLLTDLSKVPGLTVTDSVPTDAAAQYVVSGSVQLADKRLRLNIHLGDRKTGRNLWSERFDRAAANLFAAQEELGPAILRMLPTKVSEAELRRVAQRYTRNLEAYEHFLRGQSALLVRQQTENETARSMFRRAIALDTAFARAYAGLALTYCADYRNRWNADGTVALERALELALTAGQIDPGIPEISWVLAFVNVERRRHREAMDHLKVAIGQNPSFADGYALMGGIQTYIGRPAETAPLLRTAMRLNHNAGHLYYLILGRAYLFLGDLEQARVNLEQALLRNPENLEGHVYMAALHVASGDMAAATWEADQIMAMQPGFTARGWIETHPMTDGGQRSRLAEALGLAGL